MTDVAVGLLVVLAYVGTVLASVPVALVALLVGLRTGSYRRALGYSLGGGLALLGLGSIALGVAVDPLAGATLLGVGALAVAILGAVPLVVGRELVGRLAGREIASEDALKWTLAGWPVALNVSVAVFVAPGGPARYNVTFLTGLEGALSLAALLGVIVLGPGLVGTGLARAFGK